jgi:hypothetical protein
MGENKPTLSIYCALKNGTEEEFFLDIDLSFDPLLNAPYCESWLLEYLKNKYNGINNIDIYNILQFNSNNCKNALPEWYYK